jgi:hypothetical protein
MKVSVWLALFIGMAIAPAAALADPPAPAPAKAAAPAVKIAAPRRVKVTCAQYRESVEKASKHAAFDLRLKAGTWGRLPKELHRLPRRAKLCGIDSHGQAVIASPLFGQALEDYYTPLFTKAEFAPLDCAITAEQTQCHCKRRRDVGVVVTDTANEIYVLAVLLH